MMTYYGVIGSPNSRNVEAVINHTGLPVERKYLGFFDGDLKTPEYLALNPNGKVPSLTDGDFVLWESWRTRLGTPRCFPRICDSAPTSYAGSAGNLHTTTGTSASWLSRQW